jgi:hypothetical protein
MTLDGIGLAMARLFKGVGVGTHWHTTNPRIVGFTAHSPGGVYNVDTVLTHIARTTTTTPCISLTRSYGIAETYARNASRMPPTRAAPAYVYEIDLVDPLPPTMRIVDPVAEVTAAQGSPVAMHTYHHDGDINFLLGVVDPRSMAVHLMRPVRTPPTSAPTSRPANLSMSLEAMVRALRDFELLVIGTIPAAHVIAHHSVY